MSDSAHERFSLSSGQAKDIRNAPVISMDAFQDAVIHAVEEGGRISALFAQPIHDRCMRLWAVLSQDNISRILPLCADTEEDGFPSLTPLCA